ncbi:uncharacterized protein K441DRAFT_52076 [Cenococcum geophilum 1.58]|uniref:Uncharacterized protein n=1 Tax=Cenococcum geophilum 1.58 TaxID=794803 RepID=A0ACC8EK59_9PEZI|nr:hypothetical protein K441DRAFT_52076 [Cenococcum geophilum 1.58]
MVTIDGGSRAFNHSPSIPSTSPRSPPPPPPTLPAANPSTAKPTTSSHTRIATPISQPSTKDSTPRIIGKSDTLDTFTKRTALFSGFEVKPASGDHTEAELQMSIWIATSLRKKQELAQIAQAPFEQRRWSSLRLPLLDMNIPSTTRIRARIWCLGEVVCIF